MEPVRDLLNRTRNGAIISGRAHYFSSDAEMRAALGLDPATIIVSTPPEFSIEETRQFLAEMGFEGDVPIWLPRKPLVAEMFADFSRSDLITSEVSRPVFWESIIDALCRSYAKIRLSYDPETIKMILCKLSRLTRTTRDGLGPIPPIDVQKSFSSVVGQLPAQEAASMLQRLPGLGRVAAENDDRQFVDDFIVQGLRGFDVANIVATYETGIDSGSWRHGAGDLGLEVIANRLNITFSMSDAISRIQDERSSGEGPLHSDIVGGILLSDMSEVDFSGSYVQNGYLAVCDLSEKSVAGLHISGCEIGILNIFNSDVRDTTISHSTVEVLDGTSGEGLPIWISDCAIGSQTTLDTVARIKKSPLKPSEIILVTILRKTFFQPGSGRKEDALLRGLGAFGDSKLQARILNIMMSRGFLAEAPGRSGKLYVPERSKTARARQMVSQLQQSQDQVWKEISEL